MAAKTADLFVAFDFDETLIPCNSDIEVPRLVNDEIFQSMLKDWQGQSPGVKISWTLFMDSVFAALATTGASKADLSKALATIRCDEGLIHTLRELRGGDCDERRVRLVIVSDANEFFIHEILSANDLDGVFDEVITNASVFRPSEGSAPDRLSITAFTSSTSGRLHACTRGCPANLCKTDALLHRFDELSSRPNSEAKAVRVIYVGDGGNDLCPCMTLMNSGDLALPRSGFPLAHKLEPLRDAGVLECEVQEWGDWGALASRLKSLL